jgi:hypothetical protein
MSQDFISWVVSVFLERSRSEVVWRADSVGESWVVYQYCTLPCVVDWNNVTWWVFPGTFMSWYLEIGRVLQETAKSEFCSLSSKSPRLLACRVSWFWWRKIGKIGIFRRDQLTREARLQRIDFLF